MWEAKKIERHPFFFVSVSFFVKEERLLEEMLFFWSNFGRPHTGPVFAGSTSGKAPVHQLARIKMRLGDQAVDTRHEQKH